MNAPSNMDDPTAPKRTVSDKTKALLVIGTALCGIVVATILRRSLSDWWFFIVMVALVFGLELLAAVVSE